jgi:hypothetical protein
MSKSGRVALVLLFILVLISLGMNVFLYWQINQTRQKGLELVRTARGALPGAISELEAFEKTTITHDFQINQEFPVQTEIAIKQTLDIPIQTTVPISQVIDTTVMVGAPGTDLAIPLPVNVPVNVEIPIDTTVSITIDRTVPISTTIPLDLTVPLAIKVSETDLAQYIEQLRAGLKSLDEILAGIEQSLRIRNF